MDLPVENFKKQGLPHIKEETAMSSVFIEKMENLSVSGDRGHSLIKRGMACIILIQTTMDIICMNKLKQAKGM